MLEGDTGERSARYCILRYETEWPLEVVQIIYDDPHVTGDVNEMGGKGFSKRNEDAALEAMRHG